jgi:lysophospholipase L1-like esterase/pimeloyl-ACP methyl ester carboxylesterase
MNMERRTRLLLAAFIGLCSLARPVCGVEPMNSAEQVPVRVACVGDSIVEGAFLPNPEFDSYPGQLKRMLGEQWDVRNFGVSGTTLLNAGDKPYQKEKALESALKFNPNIVIIGLGGNDTKPDNWKFKDQFIADYKNLIGKFRSLPSKPRILVCQPAPAPGAGNYGINEPAILEEIPMIQKIAEEEGVAVINMHEALVGKDNLFPDRVHPNLEGAAIMAKTAFMAVTGKEFEGDVPAVGHSLWEGYHCLDFEVDGRVCILVLPKTPAAGNPWIWRTEFFGAFPSADLALLGKGFHVAYMNVQNMYGAPAALDHMDKFHEHVTKTYGLADKVVLEGFSRGGLFAFNWAARNPDKVACLYVDAPVCDFKSWPAGKGKARGSPEDWERCKKAYGLTEEQALAYRLNPVDNLKPIAAAKIPIIAVCGNADTDVPIEENIMIVKQRYQELGGEIQVIVKPGAGHHPHSLADPTPIVAFILSH